jgi:hypothetical protein
MSTETPRTEELIRVIQHQHKEMGLDDLEHYMDMCGQLASHAREMEQQLAAVTKERDDIKHVIECANTPLMRDVLKERDESHARELALREALHWTVEILDAHEVETLDCDRRGEKYCTCLERQLAKARAALNSPPPPDYLPALIPSSATPPHNQGSAIG